MEESAGQVQRVTAAVRALRFDAGAPSLDLLATLGRRPSGSPVERLGDVGRLAAWCDGVGVALREQPTEELRTSLVELREAAFAVATAALDGTPCPPGPAALVAGAARGAVPPPTLHATADDALAVRQPMLDAGQLRALLARDLLGLLADPRRRSRLRRCAAEPCRMLFLDTAGGRPRRWCSMRLCGNTAKAARHRNRAAATDTDTDTD